MDVDAGCQTYLSAMTQTHDRSTMAQQTEPLSLLASCKFANDDKAMHYYTGLVSYTKIIFVLLSLGPAV